jgi:hypothetical protein
MTEAEAERAVLAAAERLYQTGVEAHGGWTGTTFVHHYDRPLVPERWTEFVHAMQALRDARKSAPRWRADGQGIVGENGIVLSVYHVHPSHGPGYATSLERDHVLELLNKADPA